MKTLTDSMGNRHFLVHILLCTSLLTNVCSCKSVARKISKETMGEVAEESVDVVAKKGGKAVAKKTSEKFVRNMEWDDVIRILRKENPTLSRSIERFSGAKKKRLASVVNFDDRFFTSLRSSRTLADEYSIFTESAPKLADNIDFFRAFAKSDYNSKNLGKANVFKNIVAREEKGIVKLIDIQTGDLIAKYSDGIIRFSNIERIIPNDNMVKGELIPNILYKMKGPNGLEYAFSVDNLGRVLRVDAKNVSPDELVTNVLRRDGYVDLGPEWNSSFRKLKQTSHGNDVTATLTFKYVDDGVTPQYARVEASTSGKKRVSQSFSNVSKAAKNEAVVKRVAKTFGMSSKKQNTLLMEMSEDVELEKLINANPEFNIQRWLNTRNHVDVSQIAVTPKGEFPKNARVYAGNIYYFNPHLNSALFARLKRGGNTVDLRGMKILSTEDLILLDKKYPGGVPFSKKGFPDFSNVAAKGADGNPILMDIGKLSGDSKKDIAAAETMFQNLGNAWVPGFTWHHVEGTTALMRVPTDIHQLVDHTGGMSMSGLK